MKHKGLLLLAGLIMIWAVGCSDNPTDTSGDTPNLADEFGGYTATSEAPGFGDPELIAAENDEEEIDDPILTAPAVQNLVNDMDAGMFHFRAVWGQIPGDSTVTEVTDWTGSLTLNRGALIVRRLVRFELNQDYYLPRTDRGLVEWVSATTIHNDGIVVEVLVPPADPDVDSEPVTLTFETGPYSRTFTLEELASLDELISLDNGLEVAFHGVQFFRQACPRGILAGKWGYDEEGNGIYEGLWFSPLGHVDGFLQGHFGQDDEGRNVFFGKWIDRDGTFEGLLRGTWGHHLWTNAAEISAHRGSGWFRGLVFDADENRIGGLAGRFGAAPSIDGGWFQGRWKLFCNEDSAGTGMGNGNGHGYGVLDDGMDTAMM